MCNYTGIGTDATSFGRQKKRDSPVLWALFYPPPTPTPHPLLALII